MVRLLKVKELEERKRHILAKSEMHRQTLKLEVANLKFSGTLLKRRLKPRVILSLLGLTALPVAGFMYGRKQHKEAPKAKTELKAEAGLLPALLTGLQLFKRFAPMIQKFRERRAQQTHGRRQNLARHH